MAQSSLFGTLPRDDECLSLIFLGKMNGFKHLAMRALFCYTDKQNHTQNGSNTLMSRPYFATRTTKIIHKTAQTPCCEGLILLQGQPKSYSKRLYTRLLIMLYIIYNNIYYKINLAKKIVAKLRNVLVY